MGYTTDFEGKFTITPPLDADQTAYLRRFAETRRMKRHAKRAEKMKDPLRELVGLPIGVDAEHFTGSPDEFGQDDTFVVDYNRPPETQPGLWCQWRVSDDGASIAWDSNEKFYNYVEWLIYIRDHFLRPWGRELNGVVKWRGEDRSDVGTITAKKSAIKATGERPWRNIVERVKAARPALAKVCAKALRDRSAAEVIADVAEEILFSDPETRDWEAKYGAHKPVILLAPTVSP